MKVLIDIGHPAHVHYYSGFASIMKLHGHEVKFTARKKDVSIDLLRYYNTDFECVGNTRSGFYRKVIGIVVFSVKIYTICKRFRPDVLMGAGALYLYLASFSMRLPIVISTNTEVDPIMWLYARFLPCIITPRSFSYRIPSKKHVTYPGNCEMAYLHPKRFSPDEKVLAKYGIKPKERLILVRFVSFVASDDYGKRGIDGTSKVKLINRLLSYGKVIISSESELNDELSRYRLESNPEYEVGDLQSLEYYAELFIGDSGAMASECSVLGTPSIYVSSKSLGFISELTDKYKLCYQLIDIDDAIGKAIELLSSEDTARIWELRRERLLFEAIDVSAFLVWFIENYPQSFMRLQATPDYVSIFR